MIAHDEAAKRLQAVALGVREAGQALAARFRTAPPPADREATFAALHANDAVSDAILRPALTAALPDARWVEDEEGGGPLPPGDWWVVDTAEGNINHIHGMTGWCVSATLIRDNLPVLTAVDLPLAGESYSAVAGQGAWRNGIRLAVSKKVDLGMALVASGQATPGEDAATRLALQRGVGRMLERALLTRLSVPATLELVEVASGRLDAFWQPSAVRAGLVSGALLVAEAGGVVSDFAGSPWSLASDNILAAAPGLHQSMIAALADMKKD